MRAEKEGGFRDDAKIVVLYCYVNYGAINQCYTHRKWKTIALFMEDN